MGLTQPISDGLWDGEVGALPKPTPRAERRPRRFVRPSAGVWLKPKPAAPIAPVPMPTPRRSVFFQVASAIGMVIGLTWALILFPFRVAFRLLAFLGRLAGLVTGFCLMVLGAALFPSSLVILGLPIFALGLVMTLRSVE